MSRKPNIPYSVQLGMAALSHNSELMSSVMYASVGNMTHELLEFAQSYDYADLPLVLASMKLIAQSLTPVLDASGKQLLDMVLDSTTCITFTGNPFKKDEG